MIRLAIVVEGRTEEEFVKTVLADYLGDRGVEPSPILLGVGRSGPRGGNVSIPRLVSDMAKLSYSFDAVSSLVDFYGFRGKKSMSVEELEQEIGKRLKRRLATLWREDRALPYVQKHEFEGLLFSDVGAFSVSINATAGVVDRLRQIRSDFPTPEDINDNAHTAPSKRIKQQIQGYQKVQHGPLIAQATGIDRMLAECPRFCNWVQTLESLGTTSEN